MIGGREWIRNMINGGTPLDWLRSREAYEEYRQETGLNGSYKTYKRAILKVLSNRGKPHSRNEEETGSSFQQNGNYAYAKYLGERIITLDDLIKVCKIDTSVWNINNVKYNKWEGYRSGKTVNLRYTDGVADGEVQDNGGLHIEPLFKVEAWCSKKTFEPVNFKPVAPVQITLPIPEANSKAITIEEKVLKRAMVLSDAQMAYTRSVKTGLYTPFHDRRVFDIALQIAKVDQPDSIIWNGDFFDLPDWSDKFVSGPEFYYSLQPTLVELSWWMGQFRLACPDSKMYYIEGNHEDRMRKNLLRNAKVAYGIRRVDDLEGHSVMSIPNLLAFDKLNIEYLGGYPEGHIWLNDDICVGHGEIARGKSGATVNAVMNEATHSQVFGHIHRNEIVSKTVHERRREKMVIVGSFGTMAKIGQDGPPSKKSKNNWQQGFGFIDYTEDGYVSLVPVFVDNGKAAFERGMYVGSDSAKQLKEDTGWNF